MFIEANKEIKYNNLKCRSGICPYCGSPGLVIDKEYIDYEVAEIKLHCDECGRFLSEKYKLKFIGDTIDESEFVNIMDDTNSHNIELVDKINKLWFKNKKYFKPIMLALYARDAKEMYDKNIVDKYGAIQELWEDYAYDYLMKVADDKDLQTIIDYIR